MSPGHLQVSLCATTHPTDTHRGQQGLRPTSAPPASSGTGKGRARLGQAAWLWLSVDQIQLFHKVSGMPSQLQQSLDFTVKSLGYLWKAGKWLLRHLPPTPLISNTQSEIQRCTLKSQCGFILQALPEYSQHGTRLGSLWRRDDSMDGTLSNLV